MIQREFDRFVKAFLAEMSSTLISKNKDYSNGKVDKLANFKSLAEINGLPPQQMLMALASKHWTTVMRHAKGVKCSTEPVRKRLIDLANYCILFAALEDESNANSGIDGGATESGKDDDGA